MNPYQQDRFYELKKYIQENLSADIDIREVENITHYSYRNINRIFRALQGETIGKYIKRLRLEKAAEYLVYSDHGVSEIAYEMGFTDLAMFSKAFKNRFGASPTAFRNNSSINRLQLQVEEEEVKKAYPPLPFHFAELPAFSYLYLEQQGDYEDLEGIEVAWIEFFTLLEKQQLLSDKSIFFGSILDDNEISEHIHCRYRACMIIDPNKLGSLERPLELGTHKPQNYVRFDHREKEIPDEAIYNRILVQWMSEINRNLADSPVLEFYHFKEEVSGLEIGETEIYIPVQ